MASCTLLSSLARQSFTHKIVPSINSGIVFQAAWLVDRGSSPLLALFYADASFSGQSMTHHPIYSTYFFNYVDYYYYINQTCYITYVNHCDYSFTVCLLNLHEDERMKP
jgi:hypothetical protein